VAFAGEEYRVQAEPPALPEGGPGNGAVPVLVAALGPRLLRVAREHTQGTILWMANAASIEKHVAPRIGPDARIVAGLPVAVHDDVAEARAVGAEQYAIYGTLPNYQRILAHGGIAGPGDAVLVGDEAAVTAQVRELFEAGATDVWLAPFTVGEDRAASRTRTRALLKELAAG
jgi:alkanesulfonate monooxygenase SsuD/methylene tetrahydromethanopterin reductase-like flavin-dependent oxidoreductase (luciferase family)